MPKVEVLTMMYKVFDFVHRKSKSNVINLQSEYEINNAHYIQM
jgi:hypothetical protein